MVSMSWGKMFVFFVRTQNPFSISDCEWQNIPKRLVKRRRTNGTAIYDGPCPPPKTDLLKCDLTNLPEGVLQVTLHEVLNATVEPERTHVSSTKARKRFRYSIQMRQV